MRYYLTSIRNTIINKSIIKLEEFARMWSLQGFPLYALLVRMQIGIATVESSMELSQKIKNKLALPPSDINSRNMSEEILNTNAKECMQLSVHCCIVYNSQDLEAAQLSISK